MSDLVDRLRQIGNLGRPRGESLAMLAAAQHGVVAVWQLHGLGFTPNNIHDAAKAGRLHRLHRGVYAVGHNRLTPRGYWMAAVLACGPDAVLSHSRALVLWELRASSGGPIDVTVPGRTKKGHKGIRVHNVRSLDVSDTAEIDGIPVTSLPRTLLDYAEVARSHQQLRHALDAAERRELLDHGTLQSLLARSVGRRGAKRLRAAVGEMRGPAPWTQSGLERAFLALIREAGLPEPQANVLVAGELVDFFWPEYGLVVETDGYDYHKSRASFESDRRRDAELQLAGLRVVRFTEAQVWQEPRKVVRIVTEMLARARQRRVA